MTEMPLAVRCSCLFSRMDTHTTTVSRYGYVTMETLTVQLPFSNPASHRHIHQQINRYLTSTVSHFVQAIEFFLKG